MLLSFMAVMLQGCAARRVPCRRVEEALGAAGAAAPLAGFRAEVVERLGEVEVRLAEAEAAFK